MRGFSEIAKELRISRHLTQTQLAKRLWAQKSIISAYETGVRQPSVEMLIRYSRQFRVSVDYLLGLKNEQTLNVSGLTHDQIAVLDNLINEFRKNDEQNK